MLFGLSRLHQAAESGFAPRHQAKRPPRGGLKLIDRLECAVGLNDGQEHPRWEVARLRPESDDVSADLESSDLADQSQQIRTRRVFSCEFEDCGCEPAGEGSLQRD